MSDQNYNPNSIDAALSRIESTLNAYVTEHREYRKTNDTKQVSIEQRVSSLEGDKKKILGIALGAGGLPHVLAKIFGSGAGQ
jgi:hypothetical protein